MKRSQKIHLVLVTAMLASCNRMTVPSRSMTEPLTDSTFAGAAAGDSTLTAGPEFEPVDDNYPNGYGPDTPPWYFPFNFNFYGVYYPYGWAPIHRSYNPGVVRTGKGHYRSMTLRRNGTSVVRGGFGKSGNSVAS